MREAKLLYLFVGQIFLIISCLENRTGDISRVDIDTSKLWLRDSAAAIEKFARKVVAKNNVGILQMNFNEDTMSLVSDGDLTWKLFTVQATPNGIKKKFPFVFIERDSLFESPLSNRRIKGITLRSALSEMYFEKPGKSEMIADDSEHEDQGKQPMQLHYALIKDSIQMAYGVKVGMSKMDFFNTIFGPHESTLLSPINVVINSDPAGEEFDVCFLFKGDILKEVTVKRAFTDQAVK